MRIEFDESDLERIIVKQYVLGYENGNNNDAFVIFFEMTPEDEKAIDKMMDNIEIDH